MNALLVSINAKFIHTNNAVRSLKANSDFHCDILEYTIKDDIQTIIDDIEQNNYDVIGFSVYIWNVEKIQVILNKLSLDIPIVLGGPEVSYDPETFLSIPNVTYIIKGEGEMAFNQLLVALKNNQSLNTVANLSYQKGSEFIHHPIQEIKDLTALTPPYFNADDIVHIPNRIAYIESSRGCPYHCSYCLSSLEKTVRFFDVNTVKRAISYYMTHRAKTIKFLDRTFNANKKTLEIINHIILHDNNQTVFQFEITGDVLDQSLIDFIHNHARKGLFRFEIGIQSLNKQTNLLVQRTQNNTVLFDNIQMIINYDIIDLHLDLIAGLPNEDKQSFKYTFDQVFKLGAKELQLGFLKLLRGTLLRTQAPQFGMVYMEKAPYEIIETDVLSTTDIAEIHLVEHMLELYHNKGYFGKNMRQILCDKVSPYDFLLQVGQHYTKHQYNLHRYQLEDVYQGLFPFLSKKEVFLVLQ
ncbi:MAG: DUF4080 domain-containing protein, partial [Candidatus Izimaplasma sp.]|nr:DUF4080 domain-containing protein [Candidatus Izimaplasma bacterium]